MKNRILLSALGTIFVLSSLAAQELDILDDTAEAREWAKEFEKGQNKGKTKEKELSVEDFILQSDSSPASKMDSLLSMAQEFEKAEKTDRALELLWKMLEIPGLNAREKARAAAVIAKTAGDHATDPMTGAIIPKYYVPMVKAQDLACTAASESWKQADTPADKFEAGLFLISCASANRGDNAPAFAAEALRTADVLFAVPRLDRSEKIRLINYTVSLCRSKAGGKYRHLAPEYFAKQLELCRIPGEKGAILLELADLDLQAGQNLKAARKALEEAAALEGVPPAIRTKIQWMQDMLSDTD